MNWNVYQFLQISIVLIFLAVFVLGSVDRVLHCAVSWLGCDRIGIPYELVIVRFIRSLIRSVWEVKPIPLLRTSLSNYFCHHIYLIEADVCTLEA